MIQHNVRDMMNAVRRALPGLRWDLRLDWPALRALLGRGESSPALGRVVVQSIATDGHRPSRHCRVSTARRDESAAADFHYR